MPILSYILSEKSKNLDQSHALQLSESVWWVGHYLPDDSFQCHVYLIEDGDQSVLIDPGSNLTFKWTLKKIEEIIPFRNIKYFIVHHQDPDITGALLEIDTMIERQDARILSHWRTNALLKHYGLKTPLACVEEMGWKLHLPHRQLSFIFTPYLHFAGSFTSYDLKSKILFSSDLFGGFTEGWSLMAEDKDYFDSMKLFHEHYMPSNEILRHSLAKFEEVDIEAIAPQHGSIIPRELVVPMIKKLGTIDCGIFMEARNRTNVHRLSLLNQVIKQSYKTLLVEQQFSEIKTAVLKNIKSFLPIEDMQFFVRDPGGSIMELGSEDEGVEVGIQNTLLNMSFIGMGKKEWHNLNNGASYLLDGTALLIPLYSRQTELIISLALLTLKGEISDIEDFEETIEKIIIPLSVAVEREIVLRGLKTDKEKLYDQAMKDTLTGLYTRRYMCEAAGRLIKIHDRDASAPFSVIMLDIDHFKRINDSYGHGMGDAVLASVARIITKCTRDEDINVRYGGEEFLSIIVAPEHSAAGRIAERIRKEVKISRYSYMDTDFAVTISGGVATRTQGESLDALISKADHNLYYAKGSGRDRIILDNI